MTLAPHQARFLRIFDVICAAAGLTLLSPILAVIALFIFCADRQAVLFRQTRVGQGGRWFEILKFRTMRAHAKGVPITAEGDTRITPVGRWLRKFKLDELPQLVNVRRGEMSLIGPRPE